MYNGRMSYIQRDNVGEGDFFLFHHKDGVWLVGPFGIHAKPHPALVRLHPPSQLRMGLLGEEKDFLGQRSNSQAASRSPAALQEGDSGGERGGDPSAIHFSWLLQADGEVERGKASI